MSFPVPVFPLIGNVWNVGNNPTLGAPDVTNVSFQLYISAHTSPFDIPQPVFPHLWNPSLWIKTPVAAVAPFARRSIIEPNGGSGEYYLVLFREHFYLGFPQYFFGLMVAQCEANTNMPRIY